MLEIQLDPFPVLRTARLVLREPVLADANALFALRNDERVMRHLARPRATTIDDARQLIARIASDRGSNAGITWAMTLHGDDRLIGTIGYYRLKLEHHRAEVGYLLSPDQWGMGLMSEALQAVLSCGFHRFNFHSIEAVTDPRNAASNRLLERNGFVREGLFRENHYWDGEFQDSAVYSRLASP